MKPNREAEPTNSATPIAGERVLARLEGATRDRPVPLGRYDVVGPLGRGGMGAVYEAIDRSRGNLVALKTLLSSEAGGAVEIKREFRAVSDMAHPNLAPVYELGCEDGLWFFAMERIEGTDLRRWARGSRREAAGGVSAGGTGLRIDLPTRRERLTPSGAASHERPIDPPAGDAESARTDASPPLRPMSDVREAFAQIVRGLSALHDVGVWHGDVKPGNVLVGSDGRVVVVDFGLARPIEGERSARGLTSGTPTYMSPEQLVGERGGPASDFYAVGTMLYEILTGRAPFGSGTGATHVELYLRKTLRTPPAPRELLAEIPDDLSDLCMRLLRPDPAQRPGQGALGAALAGLEASAAAAAPSERRPRAVFVGRERELKVLDQAYARACAGRCVVAHVHGPSGIGKSAIVRAFLGGVRAVDRAEVLRGRCYERESVPYKGFDGIVDELATRLGDMGPAAEAILPAWIGELAQAFPALATLPSIAGRVSVLPAMEAKELRRRAWSALRQLLEVIGHERPVVLWIDDLQWADADSADLLESLVRDARRAPLLVVVSDRPAEATKNEALAKYFDCTRRLAESGDSYDVALGALSRDDASLLARSILDGLAREGADETRAEHVADEAAGVPFFIEELARFVASKGPAAEAAVASLEEAIAGRLSSLPPEQRALVEVVAVADAPVAQAVVFAAAGLDAGALPSLLALRSASMLSWTGPGDDDLVYPYHDRIREAVLLSLDALDAEGLRRRHLALGRALVARHRDALPGAWVFDAVRHLGAASELLTDPVERLATASLFLQAGRAARKGAAFPLAFSCFEGGIALLAPSAWTSAYELALALHSGAAETAYLTASWGALGARVADVKANARSAMDQLVAWEVEIDAYAGRHEYGGAIDAGMDALALLGVRLPRDPSDAELGAAFQRALEGLTRIGPSRLAAMPDARDPEVLAAMRIQVRLSPAAYFSRQKLLPIIAANLVTTSIERGLSHATPYALALVGLVMNTVGMFPVSHEWGQLAVRLIDRWEDRSLEAATRHVVFNLVCPWMVPLRTTLAPLREVFEIGRRTGDLEYASYAAHGYTHNAMYAGRPLGPLVAEAHALGDQMRALGQVNALHVHAPFEQLLEAWTGGLRDPSRLNDATFDEDALLAAAAAQGSRSGAYVLRIAMGLARYHFGRSREASDCFEIARAEVDAAASVWHVPIMHQFAVLAACGAWGELDEAARVALRPKLEASVHELRTLAGHAPFNFAHRVNLVEGELRRVDGDVRGAFARFVEAAEQARESEWINDVALARELASKCERGTARRASLQAARDAYAEWGATAKVRRLDAELAAPER